MVDWLDPVVMYHTARAKVLLIHGCSGLYFWEFITTLWFDWKLIRGAGRFKLGTFFYMGARYGALASFILALCVTNIFEDEPNCQAWNYVVYTIAITTVAFSSMLLCFRVIALSSNNKYVVWILLVPWLGTFVMLGLAHSTQTSEYIAPLFTCAKMPSAEHRNIEYYQFAFDVLTLSLMMWYLHSMRKGLGVWKFMSQQGMIYFVATTAAYLVSSVFVALHEKLGYAMSEMWKIPALLTFAVCGTRMHRDLSEFLGGSDTTNDSTHVNRSRMQFSRPSASKGGSTTVHSRGGGGSVVVAKVTTETEFEFDDMPTPMRGSPQGDRKYYDV